MVSGDTWFLTLSLVSAFLVVSMDAQSWDLAVAVGQNVDFFSQNGTLIGHSKVTEAERLKGLAYDNVTRTMFISDDANSNLFSMYISNVTETESVPNSYNITMLPNKSQITAIVFDPVNRTLFWTDDRNDTIMKMEVDLNGGYSPPKKLHDLEGHRPHGITLDICNRFIYWSVSIEYGDCIIERSKLDGSDKEVVVSGSAYDVYGVGIDHWSRKLYWIDNIGVYYQIWRSNLNGSEPELFTNGTHQKPNYIAVDKEAVYWTDRQGKSIWKIKKDKGATNTAEEMKTYQGAGDNSHVMSIISWDNIGGIDCDGILEAEKKRLQIPTTPKPLVQPLDNLTTSTKETNLSIQPENRCMNKGRYDEITAKCSCEKGYIGTFCEVSVCHNYCVHGSCTVDAKGSPKCDCGISYTGDRCESNICNGYCLNNGTCTATSEGPYCKCENSSGARCEYTNEMDKLCSLYCTQTEYMIESGSIGSCKCSEMNHTLKGQFNAPDEPLVESTIILSVLVTVIGSLVIVVGVLSYHINKLRRRPRIRKRFVVSKGGVTPLTSRPQVPSDSCEITIENCCNMNICETPCFEPKLRATPTKSSSTKVEEKNSLLDSMEGADSC